MNPLQQFYQNEVMREALREFATLSLRELGADYALAGKDTSGFQQASECIDHVFHSLETKYGIIKKQIEINSR